MIRFVTAAFAAILCILLYLSAMTAVLEGREAENANHRVPACEEDYRVQGTGDYAAGYWTEYVCVPDTASQTAMRTWNRFTHSKRIYILPFGRRMDLPM